MNLLNVGCPAILHGICAFVEINQLRKYPQESKGDEPYSWVSETKIAPWVIYVLRHATKLRDFSWKPGVDAFCPSSCQHTETKFGDDGK